MPTYRDHDSVFAYYFYRLIQYPAHVHIMTCGERDEFGGGEPSRFLLQIESQVRRGALPFRLQKINLTGSNLDVTNSALSVQKTDEVLDAVARYFERGISPSALNTFRSCPLDFYFKYILGISEEDEVEEEIGAADMGTAVHHVLEELFKPRLNMVVDKDELQAMRASYSEHLAPALMKIKMEHNVSTGYNRLVKEVIDRSVSAELDMEIDLDATVTILSLEGEYEHTLDMNLRGRELKVRFKGFVDRVERENSVVNIIDYKSGKVEQSDLSIDEITESAFMPKKTSDSDKGKPKAFQLLFYAWVYWKNHSEEKQIKASIISIRNLAAQKIPLLIDGEEMLTESHFQQFETALTHRLEDIMDNNELFAHDPKGHWCNFCPDKSTKSW